MTIFRASSTISLFLFLTALVGGVQGCQKTATVPEKYFDTLVFEVVASGSRAAISSAMRAMIRGDLSIADLPGAWNGRFEQLLGVPVPDDRRGCLQDVHWSFGLIGYFPTYTLGTLYAAQLWEAAHEKLPGLDDQIARGEFRPLLSWLREGIHSHGRRWTAGELCERMTGRELGSKPLLDYLRGKLVPLYEQGLGV